MKELCMGVKQLPIEDLYIGVKQLQLGVRHLPLRDLCVGVRQLKKKIQIQIQIGTRQLLTDGCLYSEPMFFLVAPSLSSWRQKKSTLDKEYNLGRAA